MDVQDALNNPLLIQTAILDEYVNRLEDKDIEVVDANSTFAFMLESFSQIVAEATNVQDSKLNGLYPIRAANTQDLFNHISDYEYVGFFSYPASLKISIMLHRDYLVNNAVQLPDSNYKLVVIPADTIFTIGRYKFGLYYPIHIRINTLIDSVSVAYDVTEENPLMSLVSNTLEVRADNYQGIDLVSFDFEVYQFDKTVYTESINPKIGFIKKYTYDDRFYAIRVFDISSGEKVELSYTLSDAVYDTSKPTVILKVLPDENALIVNLPQVYLTKGLVGNQLQIEIFSTLGEMDVSIANIDLKDITANFAMTSPNTDLTYTNILRRIPTIIIQPVDVRITGGSNNYTFDEIKDYTIYHNNALSVPVTRLDLKRFFERNGFIYMAKLDNLTDRRYYAYKKLYNEDEELGVANGNITINYKEEIENGSVLYQNNETIVILPTAIYKFNENVSKFEILNNDEALLIKEASSNNLAKILNNNDYFGNPHHIVINTADRYPLCTFYDLFTNKASNITFLEENIYLSAQLSIVSVVIRHLGNGAGGYIIRIGVQRSEDLINVDDSFFNCFLTATSKEGYRIGLRGVYIDTYDNIDVFDFTLETNYKLKDDRITFTNMKTVDEDFTDEYEIPLSGTMHIATFVKKSMFPDIAQDSSIINYLTDDDNSWLSVSLQKFDYDLGSSLDDVLDPNLLTTWTTIEYETYEADEPMLYDHDVYETNPDGTLKCTIDGSNNLVLNKLHSIGEPVYYEGELVIQHRIGDVILDAGGNPIQKASRIKDFTINLNAYEYSHVVSITDFYKTLSANLSAYYNTIRDMSKSILENTDVFFAPLITTNSGYYRINNTTTIKSSLELSFEFNCYVPQSTIDDEILLTSVSDKIIELVISHLSDEIISLTAIATDIKSILSVYINSIDCISLNGISDIQTLMNINVDKSPKIGRKLVLGPDNRLTYEPLITINFKALDL